MSRDKVSLPGKPSRNLKQFGLKVRTGLTASTIVLFMATAIGLGAARTNLAPESPTRGIGYHGEGGRSGR